MGFGVHECTASGTRDVLILFTGDGDPCNTIHAHCSCGSNICHKESHSKKCCETHFHHLTQDYDTNQTDHSFQLNSKLVNAHTPTTICCISGLFKFDEFREILVCESPPKFFGNPFLLNSQFRL